MFIQRHFFIQWTSQYRKAKINGLIYCIYVSIFQIITGYHPLKTADSLFKYHYEIMNLNEFDCNYYC